MRTMKYGISILGVTLLAACGGSNSPHGSLIDTPALITTLSKAQLDAGRPVFVDFTAAWCVTCQYNKKTTLADAQLLADFANRQVVLMRADWTRRDPAITQALTALGRSGVPVYALYAPKQQPVLLSELPSVAEVQAALQKLPKAP